MPVDLETDGRDYTIYLELMSDDAVIEQKYDDIAPFLEGEHIVEDGCGNGALLERIAEDEPDATLVGREAADSMLRRLEAREATGEAPDNVTYLEQDITETDPELDSADTIIASSLCHEIFSYGDGEDQLQNYLERKHQELDGGRLVIRDVIGPDRDTVWAWLNDDNGASPDSLVDPDDEAALDRLSTRARFGQFHSDFTYHEGDFQALSEALDDASTDVTRIDGREYLELDARTAAEYALTKDYTDNWTNEMEESFCFWSEQDYQDALDDAGFDVIHSRTYTSDWIREHRFEDELGFRDSPATEPYHPATNIVIVGEA